jgi:hypothetical protein
MLGWHITVYRQAEGGASPATSRSMTGARLAVWQTGVGGVRWLDELVKAGKAIDLGGDGYPSQYTAPARELLPRISVNPPLAREPWLSDPGDTLSEKWEGKTVIDADEIAACLPDEWLTVEAWDES